MKWCSRCKAEKPLEEFAKNSRKPDGKQAWCRSCKNGHHQDYYTKNKESWLKKASTYRRSIREKLDQLKIEPCTDCGNKFDPVCMDFDHIDDNKERNISTMVGHNSWEHILIEIEKCELVCANCHRMRTKARLSSG